MTDISCMGCMFQDIQIESTGFLSVVFCLTNVKLLPPALHCTDVSNSAHMCAQIHYVIT